MSTALGIPSVDLNDFIKGSSEKRNKFVQELGEAFESVGFVAVKNHGISEEVINSLYKLSKDFFSMDKEQKRGFEVEGGAGQRGYTSFGKEQAKGYDTPDLKEFFQYGQNVEDGDYIKNEYPDNVKVDLVSGFDQTFYKAYRQFEKSGGALLSAIAIYLGLEETYFEDHILNGNSILRAIHYPPITHEPKSAVRAEQHEDINLITLLVGASADGLQILNKNNEWIAVTALPEQIVVNVGDMLQRLTNNKLKSTTHRVVNPPRELWASSRFSIPFFLHPRSDMKLGCLKSCVSENYPLSYEPITAGDYLNERLREIGLKK